MIKKITYLKPLTFLITLLFVVDFGYGQTTLSPGDIAITGFNSDDSDEIAFVLLEDVSISTQIKFSDKGWYNTIHSFRESSEGVLTWTADANYACGTEIIITNTSGNSWTASSGTATETDNGFELSAGGDQILAFQGTDTVPSVFLYAISFDSSGWSNATGADSSAIPSGLTDGLNAVNFGEIDNANYNCTVTSDAFFILAAVSNAGNWTLDNFRITTLGGCTYTSCAATCSSPTVTWTSGAWVPASGPTINTPVIIDDNFSTTANGSFSACSLTVNNLATLTVNDGTFVEVQNDVTVDAGGALRVRNQGAFVQNNDKGVFTDNSTNGVILTKSKTMQTWYSYTYWSSPVSGETMENAFGVTPTDRRFRFEAANFIDTQTEVGNTNTFTPGPDDIDDDGNDWQIMTTGTLTLGVGYATTASSIVGPGGYPSLQDFTFTGALNTGIITTPLINNSGGAYKDWNLIGNPYPGAISVDQFFSANAGLVDVVYLWDQATPWDSNSGGNQDSNLSADDYAMINGTGEIGARGATGTVPARYIPSGQGFFVEALATGNAIFNNAMRVTGNNTQFFKGDGAKGSKTNSSNDDKLWVNLNSDNGISNQILVGYVNGATKNLDATYYDAPRNLSSNVAAILYSNIEHSDKRFAIQGKAPSDLNEDEIISLGFKTSIDVATLYTISIAQFQGDFLSNSPIYLKDNLLNKTHDLSASDYTFTSEVGEFNERFQIGFSTQALSNDEFNTEDNKLSIVQLNNNLVQFTVPNNSSIKSVAIFDLLGRQLYNLNGQSSSETYKLSKLKNAIFIAKVGLADGTLITKKAIKK